MRMMRWLAAAGLVLGLVACGGGGSDPVPGTDPGSGSTGGGGGSTASKVEVTASTTELNNGLGEVTITAVVKNSSNVALPDEAVTFTADSGTLSAVSSKTDTSGVATAKLSAGADKSIRDITVTVSHATKSISGKVVVAVVSSQVEVIASALELKSGSGEVTITARIKNSLNTALADEPVVFEADSGTLSSVASKTNAGGIATAVLSAGADKSNRDITVTVRPQNDATKTVFGKVRVSVVGSQLTVSGPSTISIGAAMDIKFKAVDSSGSPVEGVQVSVSSTLNNGLSATSVTTDRLGLANLRYTANVSGKDTLKGVWSGTGGTTQTPGSLQIVVSGEDFQFASPTPGSLVTVGTAQKVTVLYRKEGQLVSGEQVRFTSTAGKLSASSDVANPDNLKGEVTMTTSGGEASVWVMSTTASPATIQATLVSNGAQATLPVEFVAVTPAMLVLQVNPSAISPNTSGASTHQAEVLASVVDANMNPVKGVTVNFSRDVDPSGGTLSQASAVTDSSGLARIQYISGALSTSGNGVKLRGTVAGTSVTGTASLTVNQSALFIALGTGNVISNVNPETYKKDWTVYVTDANGVAVPGVQVTMSALPTAYLKGRLDYFDGKRWKAYSPEDYLVLTGFSPYRADGSLKDGVFVSCPSEDKNYNGYLDDGEDANKSGILEPGNVIAVKPGVVTTDAQGRATVSLEYAESYVPWVRITLLAKAVVNGTESSTRSSFVVEGASSDFTSEDNPPAGLISPFGTGFCAEAD